MIATSPGASRLTRSFVRFPSRTVPRVSRSGRETRKGLPPAGAGIDVRERASALSGYVTPASRPRARILRCLEQPLRVTASRDVGRIGPEHAAELPNGLPAVEPLDLGARHRAVAFGCLFGDAEVPGRERGHLGKMRHADDLAVTGERAQ